MKSISTLMHILLVSAIIVGVFCRFGGQFRQKTKASVKASFNKYDADGDGVLDPQEVKAYFKEDFMLDFEGIHVDQGFQDEAYESILEADKNNNGVELKQFQKALIPDPNVDYFKKYEPNYYPQKDL